MRFYFSYFKLRFKTSLQYRAAALAGLSTQFFFGMIFVMVFLAFITPNEASSPMNLKEVVSYLWLNQAFLALIDFRFKDRELLDMIKNGNIAYELCRPQKIYFSWYTKILAQKFANVTLRFLPVIIVSALLPYPYGLSLPISIEAFVLFLATLIVGSLLVTSIVMIYHVITFYTLDEKGIANIFIVIADLFSGVTIPIPFFPNFLKVIADILPFRYISDLSFRIYSGNIGIKSGLIQFGIQMVWAVITIIIGALLTKRALKKIVVQGG